VARILLQFSGMGKSDPVVEEVRRHRLHWPLERVAQDPEGFRVECERMLQPSAAPGCWPADRWLDLMFGTADE
jgi:hypothetical protein